MDTETWRVDISLADDGFDVTATARFSGCPVALVGLGVAPIGLANARPGLVARALATSRALESLAEALDQAAKSERVASEDLAQS